MSQTGFTPIQLYSSSTATNQPSASNLTNDTKGSELAINITDGKLFYKDNANAVQVIGWKTVPTTAGGTGLTTYTAGDLAYYASGTTLTKLGIGTVGQILTSTGSAPQWNTLSGVAVTTFSAGTTGFTPSIATSGAVTLAGTLVAANGGTGQSSYTIGDILYASGTTTLTKLAGVATGNALISGGVGAAPLWGKIDLTTHVSGTLPIANGGTNLTTFTANAILYASSTSALATSSGLLYDGTNLIVGAAAVADGERLHVTSTAAKFTQRLYNTNATTPIGLAVLYTGASPNNTGSAAFYFQDSTTLRLEVRSNGGIANFSGNNVNLSDERTKTDIVNAGSYLAKICAIPVRTFKYKDQSDDASTLGVIAQEVEKVAPELVDANGFGDKPTDGVPLKAVYQTDLTFAIMKALQELNNKFNDYVASHP